VGLEILAMPRVDARRCRRSLAPDVRLGEVRELKRRNAAAAPIRIQRWSRAALGWRRAATAVQAPRTGLPRRRVGPLYKLHTVRGQCLSVHAFWGPRERPPRASRVAWSSQPTASILSSQSRQHARARTTARVGLSVRTARTKLQFAALSGPNALSAFHFLSLIPTRQA
jgi:hypothetical protein